MLLFTNKELVVWIPNWFTCKVIPAVGKMAGNNIRVKAATSSLILSFYSQVLQGPFYLILKTILWMTATGKGSFKHKKKGCSQIGNCRL